jgi:hypothetical protein
MIFTQDQWRQVRDRWEMSNREWEPNEIILAAAIHDALELGVHQSWINYWEDDRDPDDTGAWSSCVYVLANPSKWQEDYGLRYSIPYEDWVKR